MTGVVLCVLDSLRADHLGCYGYARETSPALDALAKKGARFAQCHATASFTMASHAALFTGVSVPGDNNTRLPPGLETLAAVLSRAGYRTGAVISNVITKQGTGLEKGFGHWDERHRLKGRQASLKAKNAEQVVDAGLAFLKKSAGENHFLFLQFMDTHGPYTPPPRYRGLFAGDGHGGQGPRLPFSEGVGGYQAIPRFQRLDGHDRAGYYIAQYDACIRYADDQLARLLAFLEREDAFKDTVLVVTADHGESLGEHGHWFCHGLNLYEEQTRVPLVLAGAGVPEDKTVAGVASLLDLFPTLLGFAGVTVPAQATGASLQPALASGHAPGPAFFEMQPLHGFSLARPPLVYGVRTRRWKLLARRALPAPSPDAPARALLEKARQLFARARAQGARSTLKGLARALSERLLRPRPPKPQALELYDLESDPREHCNLAARLPARAAALKKQADAWLARQRAVRARAGQGGRVAMDAQRRAQFKGLGYL